jgi:hypothetical protein
MSGAIEKLILNPVEFTPGLPEMSLEALGLTIAAEPGPDYGESSQTVERIRNATGEAITDAHRTPVDCTIPLIARGTVDLPLADPLHRLEGWVAEVQQKRSGWVRRDFSDDGGFAGSVGAFVDSASVTPAQGWSMAHNQFAPGIVLKFTRLPIWYATVDDESEEFKGSAVRDLEIHIAELLGTVPGLISLQIKNEGTEDWRGCLVSIECDDLGEGETALPKYEAQDLTPKGGSTISSGVVKCPPLTAGWQTVLGSEIEGVGHMTHVGPRRLAVRLEDPSTVLDDVQWKLEWRSLGSAAWIQTQEGSTPLIVSSPVIGGYQLLDLGECRPERAITGEQRWEFRLQARSLSGSGKQPLIKDVYPASAEQWEKVWDSSATVIDGEPTKSSAAAAVDATGVGTIAWTNPENAKTVRDGIGAKATLTAGAASHYLKITGFGFAIPPTAEVQGVVLRVVRFATISWSLVFDNSVKLVKAGAIVGANKANPTSWSVLRYETDYGATDDTWEVPLLGTDVNSAEFGAAISVKAAEAAKAEIDGVEITVAYSEGADENRICFASRSIEFTDSGVRRQHITDEIWGDLVPGGFNLYAPAPGQAAQALRALIVPSVGDFAARADSASVKLSAKVTSRPGYLFAREAL